MIAADGKSYQTAFLGFDYKGETPRVSSATMERGFRQIHQNEHFTETLPNAGIKGFDYYFKKYILSRADKKALQVVGVLPSRREISISWEKMPIVIYQIGGFKFDDRAERITLSTRGEITDLVPEKTSNANYYAQGKVGYEKFSQDGVKYGILQNISFELTSVIKDNELRLADFRFVTSDKSSDDSEVQLVLKSLSPINFTIQTIRYNGALSEQVQVFIQRQYDAMNAAKQAELERVQAQRQADEQFRQSVLARRDTPYVGPASQKEREKREAQAKAAQEAREAQRKEAEAARLRAQEEKAAKARAAKEAKAAQEREALAAALGTYTNKTNGSLVLAESQTKPGLYSVVVGTTTNRGKHCNFTGECIPGKKGGFVCKISESDERNSIGLKFDKDMISISDFEYALENVCGDSVPPAHRNFIKSFTEDTPVSSTIKVNTGAYSYQESGFTGGLVISDMTDSPNKYYLNISTNNTAEGDTCSFEGECIFREGKLICTDDFIKEDPDNYIEIIPKENNILDITKQFTGPCGMRSYLTGIYAPTCLDKILETKTITGVYLGWFEAEEGVNTIGLKLSGSNKEIYLAASEEEANRLFGKTTGQKISVTYDVKQVASLGSCDVINVMKTGKVLP